MKTAKLKRADGIFEVLKELDAGHCNQAYPHCLPFASGVEWIKHHIETAYFRELTGGGDREEALKSAKRRVISANGGTAAQWDSI